MEPRLTFNEFYQSNRFAVNAVIGLGVLSLLVVGGVALVKALRKPQSNETGGGGNTGGNTNAGNTLPTYGTEQGQSPSGTYGGVTPAPETNTGQATISNTKATQLANKLFDAMEDCGTYEYMIIDVFDQLENNADVNLVVQKFGTRPYVSVAGCGGDGYSWLGTDGDLAYWLRQEVDCEDVGDTCEKMAAAGYVV